jgi:hypothetical protein
LGEDLAVAEEDEGGPELDTEGAAEGFAFAVFDFDVAHLGVLGEGVLHGGLNGLAVGTPLGAEFEHHGARQAVDFIAGGSGMGVLLCLVPRAGMMPVR